MAEKAKPELRPYETDEVESWVMGSRLCCFCEQQPHDRTVVAVKDNGRAGR
jgi:hypothetical protein